MLSSTYYIETKCKWQGLENQFCVIRVFVLTDFVLTRFHCTCRHRPILNNGRERNICHQDS